MANFCDAARPLRTFCLIVLLTIGGQVEISAAAADKTSQDEIKTSAAAASQVQKVDLGDNANIVRSLIIKGNNAFSEQQIRALMQTDVWSVYDATVVEADFEAITRFYQEKRVPIRSYR